MPLTVIYITHATSLDNEAGVASGHYDTALSPTGVEPARVDYVDEPFPGGESYVQVVARHRALLDEAAGRWDGGRILLVGCHAAYVALEHLANGATIAEAVARPRPWQPGWTYSYDEHDRRA